MAQLWPVVGLFWSLLELAGSKPLVSSPKGLVFVLFILVGFTNIHMQAFACILVGRITSSAWIHYLKVVGKATKKKKKKKKKLLSFIFSNVYLLVTSFILSIKAKYFTGS